MAGPVTADNVRSDTGRATSLSDVLVTVAQAPPVCVVDPEIVSLAIRAYEGRHTCGGGYDCGTCDAREALFDHISPEDEAALASIDEDWARWLARELDD